MCVISVCAAHKQGLRLGLVTLLFVCTALASPSGLVLVHQYVLCLLKYFVAVALVARELLEDSSLLRPRPYSSSVRGMRHTEEVYDWGI